MSSRNTGLKIGKFGSCQKQFSINCKELCADFKPPPSLYIRTNNFFSWSQVLHANCRDDYAITSCEVPIFFVCTRRASIVTAALFSMQKKVRQQKSFGTTGVHRMGQNTLDFNLGQDSLFWWRKILIFFKIWQNLWSREYEKTTICLRRTLSVFL